MKSLKNLKILALRTFLSILAISLIIPVFSGVSFAKFYCPLGYSYNAKIHLCVGKKGLKGYNAIPSTKINVVKEKNRTYTCPNGYVYSKKMQLCEGTGHFKGNTAQPTVEPIVQK